MPPIPTLRTLLVRLNVWRDPEQPRYQIQTGKGWSPCRSLEVARTYASKHGFSGIHVQPR